MLLDTTFENKDVELTTRVTSDKLQDETFTFEKFVAMLENKTEAIITLKKFCGMQNKSKLQEFVNQYLSAFPDCKHIVDYLSIKQHGLSLASFACKALSCILFQTADDLRAKHIIGVEVAKSLVQTSMSKLVYFLQVHQLKTVVAAMELFTAIVMHGKEVAMSMLKKVNFEKHPFATVLLFDGIGTDVTARQAVRFQVVQFIVALFQLGDVELITKMLYMKGFLDVAFLQIQYDSSFVCIQLVLTTVFEKAIKNEKLPKAAKKALFSKKGVLASIAKLLEWNDKQDVSMEKHDNQSGETESAEFSIQKLAYDVLHLLCCSSKFGVIFSLTFSDTNISNHFLLLFLLETKHKIASIPLLAKLAVKIFAHFPTLLSHYFHSTKLCFKPDSSFQWFSNCHLLQEVYDSQPLVPAALEYMLENRKTFEEMPLQQQVEIILSGIIPSAFYNNTLTDIISHSEEKVQMQGLIIFSSSMKKVQSILKYLKNVSKENVVGLKQKHCNEMANLLLSSYKKYIPSLSTLIDVWKSICNQNIMDNRETEMLKVLQLYQQIFLGSFDAGSFHFCDLLVELSQVSTQKSGRKSILLLLDILMSSVHDYMWFAMKKQKNSPFVQLLKFTLKVIHTSSDTTLTTKALQLLAMVGKTKNLLEQNDCDAELTNWLYFLPLDSVSPTEMVCSDKNFPGTIFNFFVKVCLSVANNNRKYFSKQKALLENCDSFSRTNSSSVKHWISSLPNVDIDTAVTDEIPMLISPDSTKSENQLKWSVSNLIIAVFEEIGSIDPENPAWPLKDLDKFLSSVLTTCFYSQVFLNRSEQFAKLLMLLFSEICHPFAFPRLSKCCQDMSSYIGGLSLIDIDQVDNQDDGVIVNLPQFSSIVNNATEFLKNSDCQRHDIFAQISPAECKITAILHHLIGLSAVLHCAEKTPEILSLFSQLSEKLQGFLDSIVILDEETSLFEEKDKRLFAADYNYMPQSDHIEASVSICITKTNYNLMLQRLLKAKHIGWLYLNNCIKQKEISAFFNSFLTKLVCSLLPAKQEFLSHYTNQLKGAMMEFLSCLTIDEVREPAYSSFDQWIVALNSDDVEEILSKASSQSCNNEVTEIRLAVISCCLKVLIEKDYKGFSDKFVHDLFHVLVKCDLVDKLDTLLDITNKLMQQNISLTLFVPKEFVAWSFQHLNNHIVLNMLQMILGQNIVLQQHYLCLCSFIETHELSSLKKSKKLLHLPVVAFLVGNFCLKDAKFNVMLNEIVSCFEKQLVSALLDLTKDLNDNKVTLLLWLISNNSLSSKRLKKLKKKLPSVLEIDFQFIQRWKVLDSFMKNGQNMDSAEMTSFRMKVINSLMSLICAAIEKKQACISLVTVTLANLLKETEKMPIEFGKEDCNLPLCRQFITLGLKNLMHDVTFLGAVLNLTRLLKFEVENAKNAITPEELHTMITHHSKFLEVMVSEGEQWKEVKQMLLRLLQQIVFYCDSTSLNSKDFVYLLASYNGTLSESDQVIFQIMQIYEWKGISASKFKPFFWGQLAISYYPSLNKKLSSLSQKPDPTKVLDCINQDVMIATLKKFPTWRQMPIAEKFENKISEMPTRLSDTDEDCYDPVFLLNVLNTFLAPENRFDPLVIVKSHILSFIFQCLSSRCQYIRQLATRCLHLCEKHIDSTRLLMREVMLSLIRLVKRSMILKDNGKKIMQHSSFNTLYLSHAAMFIIQNHSSLLKSIFIRLFNHPRLNMNGVANFIPFFSSSTKEYEQERVWILEILRDGMHDMVDYGVAETTNVFQILISFYNSSLCVSKCRKLILEIFVKACQIPKAVYDLVYKCALFSWIQSVICRQRSDLSLKCDFSDSYFTDSYCEEFLQLVAILMSIQKSIMSKQKKTDQKKFVELLSFALPQSGALGMELLENSLLFTSTEEPQSLSVSQAIYELLHLLNKTFAFGELRAVEYSFCVKVTLTDRQCTILQQASDFASKQCNSVLPESLHVIKHWFPDLEIEGLMNLVECNLIWGLKTLMKVSNQQIVDCVHSLLFWIESCLQKLDINHKKDLKDFQCVLVQSIEIIYQLPSSSLEKSLIKTMFSIISMLLHSKRKYSDKAVHELRSKLYQDTLLCKIGE